MSQNWFPGQQPQPTAPGPYQQQWAAAAPAGYGQPQQAQGWAGGGGRGQWPAGQVPGQFQQPHFPGQHGMQPGIGPQQHQQFHSQHPMSGPQHGPGTGFPQQQLMQQQQLQAMHQQEQQRQQALLQEQRKQQALLQEQRRQQALLQEQRKQQALLQEQRRQQALLQEQQRQAREEQRKREFEIQKRRLAKMGVSKTSKPAANPLDELFGKKQTPVPTTSSSSAALSTAPSSEQPTGTQPLSEPQPLPKTQPPSEPQLPHPPPEQTTPTTAEGEGQETKEAAKPNAAGTYEKLMAESLINLDLQSSTAKGRSEFKVPVPVATPIPHPTPTAQPPQHIRARAWTADAGEFSGMFAQHPPQQQQPMDSFGTFQSGPANAAATAFPTDPATQQLQLQNQPPNVPLQSGGALQPNDRATFPTLVSQPLAIGTQGGRGLGQMAGTPDTPHILSTTTPTTAYSRPILATSIASGMASSIQDQPFGAGGGVDAGRMRSTSTPLQSHPALQSRGMTQSSNNSSSLLTHAKLRDVSNVASLNSAGRSVQEGGATASVGFTNLSVSHFPPVYQEVYQKCAVSGGQFINTELLFPILTSSGLPRGVLKELWSTANRAVPGKLSETELCVLLGLVGLKQSGHPSPTVEDLKKVAQPPIPKLSTVSDLPSSLPQRLPAEMRKQSDDFGDFQEATSAVTSQPPPLPTPTGKILQPVQPVKPELSPPLLPQNSSTGILFPQPSAPSSTQPPASTPSGSTPSSLKPATSMPSQITQNLTHPGDLGKKLEAGDGKESSFPLPKVQSVSKANKGAGSGSSLDVDAFAGFTSKVAQPPASTSKEPVLQPQAKPTGDLFPPLHSGENKGREKKENWADFSQFGNGAPSTTIATTSPFVDTSQPQTPPTAVSENSSKQQPQTQAITSVAQPMSPLGLEILEEQFLSKILQQESKATPTDDTHPQGDEDFGEFEAYSSPTAKQPPSGKPQVQEKKGIPTNWTLLSKSQDSDAVKVWITCLSKCEELLGTSARVFASVQEAGILEEIVQAEEGRNKLRGIAELFRLSKRIHCSLRTSDTSTSAKHLAEGIFQHWRTLVETLPNDIMEQLYLETAPRPVEKEEQECVDVLSDSISKCSLCLEAKRVAIPQALALDGRGEEYGLQLLFHRGQSYHASCANFWCNAVQEELPTL